MYRIHLKYNAFFSKALKILAIKIFLFSLLFIVFDSCKKEQSASPTLQGEITSPTNGFSCSFDDTITVSGNLTCDQPIQLIYLGLTDQTNNSVVPSLLIGENEGTTFNFSTSFTLTNSTSPTGDYNLKIYIQADGKTIFLDKVVTIHVTAIPRTLLKNYCIVGPIINPKLYEFDGSSTNFIAGYNLNFSNLIIDSHLKRIYISAKEKLIALNSNSLAEEFQLSPVSINSDSFLTSEYYNSKLILSRNDGNTIYYDYNGSRQGETGENLFIRPLKTFTTGNYLYESIIKNTDRKIAVLFYPSGVARQELLIDFDLIGFSEINQTELLVVGNKAGHTIIYKYLLIGNTLQILKDIPVTTTNASFNFRSGTMLLLSNQGIIKYDYPANATQTINSGEFYGVNYDEVNDILYCFSGNNITQLQGTSFAQIGSSTLPDSVLAVQCLYSK